MSLEDSHKRSEMTAPAWMWGVAVGVSLCVLFPVMWLLVQAFQTPSWSEIARLFFRPRMGKLLTNTSWLLGSVWVASLLVALPFAWLSSRVPPGQQGVWVLVGVFPLAIPSYILAYVYLSLGGNQGLLAQWLGWEIPRIRGFWGSWFVLTLCNFPYFFFNLRTAFLAMDASLEEAAHSLGATRWAIWRHILWPQLWPGVCAGGLLVGLHVLGNFEVVSLMSFKTLSWELFQYRLLDRNYSAWLSLFMLGVTAVAVGGEAWFLRRVRLARVGSGGPRFAKSAPAGWRLGLSWGLWGGVAVFACVVPLCAIGLWSWQGIRLGVWGRLGADLWGASLHSLWSSGPAALLCVLLALPLVRLSLRYPSWGSRLAERATYFGYAIPPIALALSLVFVTLRWLPGWHLSLPLLVGALTIHFLVEAVGPLRTSLFQLPPRLEEAAHSLGAGPWRTFWKVVFPGLRTGLFASLLLTFLASLKELPLHLILAPSGYSSLAMEVWDHVENIEYAKAAPFALLILGFSVVFVLGLLWTEKKAR